VHYRLSEPESYQVACKFFTQLGKQVLKIQSKIETRLSQIEEYKEVTFSRIQQIAKQTFSEATNIEFEIYGSMATKLAIDTSDMDIAVYGIIPADKIA
jgi:DNA polymerase sigma